SRIDLTESFRQRDAGRDAEVGRGEETESLDAHAAEVPRPKLLLMIDDDGVQHADAGRSIEALLAHEVLQVVVLQVGVLEAKHPAPVEVLPSGVRRLLKNVGGSADARTFARGHS